MQVTAVRNDNTVIVNGVALKVDCGDLPSVIRVIHWNGKSGWIEFNPAPDGFVPNMKIVDFSPYTHLVDRWRLVLAEQNAKVAEARSITIEEEIARIEAKKQQAKDFEQAEAAGRAIAEQGLREKQEIAEKLAALEAQQVDHKIRIKELEARLEAIRAGGVTA